MPQKIKAINKSVLREVIRKELLKEHIRPEFKRLYDDIMDYIYEFGIEDLLIDINNQIKRDAEKYGTSDNRNAIRAQEIIARALGK